MTTPKRPRVTDRGTGAPPPQPADDEPTGRMPDDEPTDLRGPSQPVGGGPVSMLAASGETRISSGHTLQGVGPGNGHAPVEPLEPLPDSSLTGDPSESPDDELPQKPTTDDKQTVGGAVWTGVKDAGAPVVHFLDMVGGHLILVGRALSWLPRPPYRVKNYLEAAEYIGFGSLPIVLLVGCFTGMVLSLQSIAAFRQFGLEAFSGGTTGKALSTELGPVLTSLMLAGRAGAGIATELGTMRITEQIDALESMAVNPVQFLVLPRVIAAMIVTPILTLLFFVIGMGGAYLVAIPLEHVDQGQWISNLRDITQPIDVVQGLTKAIFFGFMIALIGCYQGFHASGGGRGVGMGTTRAVVIASVTTLISDYFLSDIWLSIFGTGKGH